jgi:hypothetical protein
MDQTFVALLPHLYIEKSGELKNEKNDFYNKR